MNETYQRTYALQSRSRVKDATLAVGAAIALSTSGCDFVMNVAEDPTYFDRLSVLMKYSKELGEGVDYYYTSKQLAESDVELAENMRLVREIREKWTGVEGKVGPQKEYEAKHKKRRHVSDNQKIFVKQGYNGQRVKGASRRR
jgi:hypothetical protein